MVKRNPRFGVFLIVSTLGDLVSQYNLRILILDWPRPGCCMTVGKVKKGVDHTIYALDVKKQLIAATLPFRFRLFQLWLELGVSHYCFLNPQQMVTFDVYPPMANWQFHHFDAMGNPCSCGGSPNDVAEVYLARWATSASTKVMKFCAIGPYKKWVSVESQFAKLASCAAPLYHFDIFWPHWLHLVPSQVWLGRYLAGSCLDKSRRPQIENLLVAKTDQKRSWMAYRSTSASLRSGALKSLLASHGSGEFLHGEKFDFLNSNWTWQ